MVSKDPRKLQPLSQKVVLVLPGWRRMRGKIGSWDPAVFRPDPMMTGYLGDVLDRRINYTVYLRVSGCLQIPTFLLLRVLGCML